MMIPSFVHATPPHYGHHFLTVVNSLIDRSYFIRFLTTIFWKHQKYRVHHVCFNSNRNGRCADIFFYL